ncbi:hypothetical protein DPX16_13422 [Anabarilius grahami]|uniref:LINE-1 type transposase domain-containing protein 1 n=1 Tax=Anabarilius grahami TaxID=495550 RepID=A0A3N0YU73_ANAGA|nr:hypothetical protein DPX16_13422 [Anabarilius grahami]
MSAKHKPADQAVPASASDFATEDAPTTQDTGNVAILSTMSSIRSEIRSMKSDIGDIIDSKIEQLAVSIRGELTAFQEEVLTVDEYASKLAGLEANISTSSDTVAKLEQEMGRLKQTHEIVTILQKVAKMQQVTFKGQIINIFPDYPPAVVKRHTLFKRATELLKDKPGVKYGLQYPAKLRVSYNGKEHYFTDPDKAVRFAENCFGLE